MSGDDHVYLSTPEEAAEYEERVRLAAAARLAALDMPAREAVMRLETSLRRIEDPSFAAGEADRAAFRLGWLKSDVRQLLEVFGRNPEDVGRHAAPPTTETEAER